MLIEIYICKICKKKLKRANVISDDLFYYGTFESNLQSVISLMCFLILASKTPLTECESVKDSENIKQCNAS